MNIYLSTMMGQQTNMRFLEEKWDLKYKTDWDEVTIKNFIYNHIEDGTLIITDGWVSYNFLDCDETFLGHEIHHQGGLIFGLVHQVHQILNTHSHS